MNTTVLGAVGAATAALVLAGCGDERAPAFTGYAEADLVYVAAAGAGVLERLDVARGASVAPDAPLFALETESERIDRAAAQARMQRARAQAQNLRTGRRPPELRVIEQQLAQAEAELEVARQQLERNQALVAQGFVAAIRLDELRAAYERDQARVAEMRAQLVVARTAARPDEIAAAEAEQRAAASDVAQAGWREQQKVRRAPQAALVYDVLFRVGEWVPAGTPVVVLQPEGALKVRFFVPQGRLAQFATGTRVRLGCDGCPADLGATVKFVAPRAEYTPPVIYSNESRDKLVFLVEAQPDAAARKVLKAGQPLDVRLPSGT
jgi:HlyD family secretion protein